MTKTWYTSKTLWINLIAVLAMIIQTRTGFIIDAETQGGLLAVINLILRVVTKAPLALSAPEGPAAAGSEGTATDPDRPAEGGFIQIPFLLMIVSLLAIGALVNGCATATPAPGTAVTAPAETPLQTAGKSLLAVKSTVVSAAIAVDGLCKAGKIGPDKCAQARAAYETSRPAYDAAVDAYLLWALGRSDQTSFNAALSRAQSLAGNLLALAGPPSPVPGPAAERSTP